MLKLSLQSVWHRRRRLVSIAIAVIGFLVSVVGHLDLKREVEGPLRLREPAPATVAEGRVPLVPESARRVSELRAPRQLEGNAEVRAAQVNVERRA